MITIKIICKDCKQTYSFKAKRKHNRGKDFCAKCAELRKKTVIEKSNSFRYKGTLPVIMAKKDKSNMTWDEPNILGY